MRVVCKHVLQVDLDEGALMIAANHHAGVKSDGASHLDLRICLNESNCVNLTVLDPEFLDDRLV